MARWTLRAPDWPAVLKAMALGAALGAIGGVVAQLWLSKASDGEIRVEDPEGESALPESHPEVLVTERREHVVVQGVAEKPALGELTREVEQRTDYANALGYKGDRRELLTKEDLEESIFDEEELSEGDGGDPDEPVEEESDILPNRLRLTTEEQIPKLTKPMRDKMNRRFEVISQASYENDMPYNDKYEAVFFRESNMLAGFDGDIMPVADELLVGMAWEAFKIKGVEHLYLRDREGDSDFHIAGSDEDYDEVYDEWMTARERERGL